MSSNKAIVEGLGELAALNAHAEDLNLSAMIIEANEDGVVTAVEQGAIDKQQELVEGLKITNSQFQAMGSEYHGDSETYNDPVFTPDNRQNHTVGSARPDGHGGYTRGGFEHNGPDAVAADAHTYDQILNPQGEESASENSETEVDPSNHTLGSARSDGSEGYTQAGHEENALDAIAEDAHNMGIPQIAPSPKPKEEPPSNDGGKGSTVEPEPAPAPKAKKVKKEKKKDSGKPVVVDLDGDGIETTDLDESEAMFDFDNDGFREKTAWVGADDGLLVFDVGGDGQVTEAKEIAFAHWTEDENDTDLEGLRTVFDSNNDGQLNELDEDWAGFRIWQDKNQNGISEEGEFLTLEEAGIQSIGLEHKEGTGEVHEEGTVNHGMIDVQMADGSVNEGGDIAFAYEADGQREVVDAESNTIIEYESDTFVFAEPDQGFTVTDYDNFVTRIHNMGIAETAVSALQYAQQSGADVVFDFGEETLTLENVSLDQLSVDLQSFADDLLVG